MSSPSSRKTRKQLTISSVAVTVVLAVLAAVFPDHFASLLP